MIWAITADSLSYQHGLTRHWLQCARQLSRLHLLDQGENHHYSLYLDNIVSLVHTSYFGSYWWTRGIIIFQSSAFPGAFTLTAFSRSRGVWYFDEDNSRRRITKSCVQDIRVFACFSKVDFLFATFSCMVIGTACWEQYHEADVLFWRLKRSVDMCSGSCLLRARWFTIRVGAVMYTAILFSDRFPFSAPFLQLTGSTCL